MKKWAPSLHGCKKWRGVEKYILISYTLVENSSGFNIKEQHYAVDIVVPKNTPIKAAADGRVVLASWTSDSGYVIILDHFTVFPLFQIRKGNFMKKYYFKVIKNLDQ